VSSAFDFQIFNGYSVAGRWSVSDCIPTPERGNDVYLKKVRTAHPTHSFRVFRAFRGQKND